MVNSRWSIVFSRRPTTSDERFPSVSSFLAHRFLHERGDPCLFGGSQLLQREGDRPHAAFVEVRRVVEAERHVPLFELLRAAEKADDLAVPGIRGHPVPGFRREGRRPGFDDRMEPLRHGAVRLLHRGDLREHVALPVRLALLRACGRVQLLGAFLHYGSFLVRESLGILVGRIGALGGLLRFPLWAHRNLLFIVFMMDSHSTCQSKARLCLCVPTIIYTRSICTWMIYVLYFKLEEFTYDTA
jgi:hypothetical protein